MSTKLKLFIRFGIWTLACNLKVAKTTEIQPPFQKAANIRFADNYRHGED